MKLSEWLTVATTKLQKAGIGTTRLDALILLEKVFGKDRAYILAHQELVLSMQQIAEINNLLKRRILHEPISYILGTSEFYGRTFNISSAVLEPRPESETMIDELKKLADLPDKPLIADIGTGSGALGITANIEVHGAMVDLIDIDINALEVAQSNVDKFTMAIKLIKSDLLAETDVKYDLLLCNLPYVPDGYSINLAAAHEPELAIFGGPDGLGVYRRLFKQVEERQFQPLYILCEALPPQHEGLVEIAGDYGYQLDTKNDFILVLKRTQK